jgi:hypothetical protein
MDKAANLSGPVFATLLDMEYDLAIIEWPPLRGSVKCLLMGIASLGFSFVMGPKKFLHE